MIQTSYLDRSKWHEQLSRAYEAWKVDFDTYCLNAVSFSGSRCKRAHFARFTTATNAIYHLAHITLNVDILDLQIYAGARRVKGRQVTQVTMSDREVLSKNGPKTPSRSQQQKQSGTPHICFATVSSIQRILKSSIPSTIRGDYIFPPSHAGHFTLYAWGIYRAVT